MKKLILLFFTCINIYSSPAQVYRFPSEKLNSQFAEIYNQTDKKENLIERLSQSANSLFSLENKQLGETLSVLCKKYTLPVDSAANILFDSVMFSFTQNHLWDDYMDRKEKYLSFLEFYNGKLCPCISEKLRQSPRHNLQENDMKDCVGELIIDTGYINGVRRVMGSATMNEVYDAAKMGLPYMYQHCTEFYNYYTTVIRYGAVYPYLSERSRRIDEIDEAITRLYIDKSPELATAFPAYKKYEADLKSVSTMPSVNDMFNLKERSKDFSGQLTLIKTYYSYKNQKAALYGQVICILKEEAPDAPLLSLRFTPAAKMKDRDKYLARINAEDKIIEPPPPPPLLELMEVKIDTLQRKN